MVRRKRHAQSIRQLVVFHRHVEYAVLGRRKGRRCANQQAEAKREYQNTAQPESGFHRPLLDFKILRRLEVKRYWPATPAWTQPAPKSFKREAGNLIPRVSTPRAAASSLCLRAKSAARRSCHPAAGPPRIRLRRVHA